MGRRRHYHTPDWREDPDFFYPYPHSAAKPYGCLGFLGDVFMTLITGGLWLIWIFVREMRRR